MAEVALQGTLFGGVAPSVAGPIDADPVDLAHGAWFVRVPGWLHGDQTLLDELAASTSWHEGSRPMYERVVDIPRLTATLPRDGPGHPVLGDVRRALRARFAERFDRIAANAALLRMAWNRWA